MKTCPFCPPTFDTEQIVLESEHCLFLQIPQPVLIGSGLIIPKQHRETVFELTAAEWQDTFALLDRVKRLLDGRYAPNGYNVGWNVGAVGGQEIFHAHLHVIPRYADEPLAGKGIRYWLKQDDNRRAAVNGGAKEQRSMNRAEKMSIDPVFLQTLAQIHDELSGTAVLWVVTGSLGMALQGVPVSVNDIDLQTDAAGAHKIGQVFAAHITRPVTFSAATAIRSYFGAFKLNGIQVEIMGDIEKKLADGRWQSPPALKQHRRFVDLENRRIPVLDLTYERRAYEQMGRRGKAAFLQHWLHQKIDN